MTKTNFPAMFFVLFLFMFPVYSSAQGLIIVLIDDNGGGNGVCAGEDNIDLDEAFMGYVKVPKIFVTNLSDLSEPGIYTLPAGTTPMFLEFDFHQTIVQLPLTHFKQDPFNGNKGNSNYTYFHSIHSLMPFNFEDFCTSGKAGTGLIEYTWRLVDASGNDYPIHDYSQPSEIFSCEAFVATCNDCSHTSSLAVCKKTPPIQSIIVEVEACVSCPEGDNFHSQYGNNGDRKNGSLSTASISPNPFNEELQLVYPMETEGKINMSIFNAQGQIVAQMTDHTEIGIFRKTIDTSQWSNGIYYCKIQSNHKSEVLRLIKAE